MSSGMFPIRKREEDYQKLVNAKNILEELINDSWEYICNGDTGCGQFDNTAIDGQHIGQLRIAVLCINTCLED